MSLTLALIPYSVNACRDGKGSGLAAGAISCSVGPPPGKECLPVHRPAGTVCFLTPLQDQDRRNAPYPEPAGQLGIFLGIDLYHDACSRQITCHLLHHRCKFAAVRSPGSPEFRQHRPRIVGHERVETPVGQRHRTGVESWQHSVAAAARAALPLTGGRYPVAHPASGTAD